MGISMSTTFSCITTQKTLELISTLRPLFQAYDIPEEISTDGGPQFLSTQFQSFHKDWCVSHCLFSA